MELELRRDRYSFFDTGTRFAGGREETQEAIVPDARPDILRIVAAYGTVMTNSAASSETGITVSGSVRVTVVYLPENGEGTQHLHATIPFVHNFDAHCAPDDLVFTGAALASVDAKTINPRKVLIRTSIAPSARLLGRRELDMCSEIDAPPESGVRVLREGHSACLCTAAGTKSFTITDTVDFSGMRTAIAEIVRWNLTFAADENNTVGHRVVFKSAAQLDLLCRASDGVLFSHRAELPFSQIVEPTGLEDGAEVSIDIVLRDAEVLLRDDGDTQAVDLNFTAEAQAVAYATRRFDAVGDLYSTSMNSSISMRPQSAIALSGRASRRQTVRESIETDLPVGVAQDIDIFFSPVVVARDQDGMIHLSADADVRVLYVGEDGTSYQARKKIAVETTVESDRDSMCTATVYADNTAFSAAAVSGVEVRFDACFDAVMSQQITFSSLESARLEPYGDDAPVRPSVVLRLPSNSETLWQVAKRFGATEVDIRQANGLADDEIPARGKLLLIPKRR